MLLPFFCATKIILTNKYFDYKVNIEMQFVALPPAPLLGEK